ncbi:MAG: MGMT family protein [Anaerolineae bacterium]|nr:MGMT family protein [Thermoflexales bacterium]MDW8293001.1 MGMT family protein [Anaerolineae bacterium]
MMPITFEDVYRVVRLIPKGRVMSYSGVARLCGAPGSARYVGFALHALLHHNRDVPWWRVVNARGRISNIYAPLEQRKRLEAEGVHVSETLEVDMEQYDAEHIVAAHLRSYKSLR